MMKPSWRRSTASRTALERILGLKRIGRFGAEDHYGQVIDWSRPEDGEGLVSRSLAERPALQAWVRDRRQAFERLLEDYSGERLAARERDVAKGKRPEPAAGRFEHELEAARQERE
jgi:hypothetical protein